MGCCHSKSKKVNTALGPRPVYNISPSSSSYSVSSLPASVTGNNSNYQTWYNQHTRQRHRGQTDKDFQDRSGVYLMDCTCENCWEYRARKRLPQPPRPVSRYAALNKDDPKAPYRVPTHIKFKIDPHPGQAVEAAPKMPGAW
ncbi:hypothetical protein PT974_09857 [Cladobotryum mycophilum]|uniref:Uncharacterized protein n=1 Tax=Cladobotryum mycophilum TaxID=491253 RepID=A0ABR0SHD1_9HYPO